MKEDKVKILILGVRMLGNALIKYFSLQKNIKLRGCKIRASNWFI